jgi:signal transduction histidine kinase/PAS domain-containing protein
VTTPPLTPKRKRPPKWLGFAAAVALPFVAVTLSRMLLPFISGTLFIFFFPAVVIAAWLGGLLPGLIATIISVALADYFIIPPYNQFLGSTSADVLRLGLFSLIALIISRLSGSLWSARTVAEQYATELAQRSLHLEQQLEEGQALTEELEDANDQLLRTNADLERAEARSAHLFTLAARLSEAATPADVARVTFQEGLAAAGADAGSLGMLVERVDGSKVIEIVHSRGYDATGVERFETFPLVAGRPASDALIARTGVMLASRAEWIASYPAMYAVAEPYGYEAFAALPIVLGDRAVAAMLVSFRGPREFDEDTRSYLETIARLCAQALERARTYDAEQSARRRTATIVEAVADGFIAFDRDLRFSYVNARAAELWDRDVTRLLGREMDEHFLDPAPLELCRRALREHRVLTQESYSAILRRWIDVRAYPAEDGGLVVFVQDVTQRRRTQEAADFLAEASELLASSTDYAETLTHLAQAAVPRLGDWCAVDVLDDPDSEMVPPVIRRVAVMHQDPEKIALGAQLTSEYPTDWSKRQGAASVILDGASLYVPTVTDDMMVATARDARHLELIRALRFHSVISVPLRVRDRVLGSLTLCMTESERTYSESDLALAEDLARRAGVAIENARLLRDAEAANASKTEFLRTISHELRQPLNATVSFLELWEMGLRGPLSTQQREDLVRIQRNQRHLMALIEDLLSFTRLEAGRLEVEQAPVRMQETLQSLDAMIAPQMTEKEVEFRSGSCDPSIEALGDRNRIVQICLNLLTNALRATPRGGRVTLECDCEDLMVMVRVSDTGVGIPADKLDDVFAPFTQLGRALNRPKEGAGLGLAIARGLAEAMGGNLTASSVVGHGSRFTLCLPRSRDSARGSPPK